VLTCVQPVYKSNHVDQDDDDDDDDDDLLSHMELHINID
jgi:hypothetical protein